MTIIDELGTDPHPIYARLRREAPVSWLPELRQWLVTSWHDVNEVLADGDRFTSDIPGSPMLRFCDGPSLLAREGEDHRGIREAVVHDYAPHRVNDYVDTIVRPHAEKLADELVPAGRAELVSEYFEPVTMLSHAELMGIGPQDVARLRRWGAGLVNGLTNIEGDPAKTAEAVAAMADLDGVLRPAVERLRTQPDGSVISHLLHSNRAAGDARADADVLPVLKQFAQGQFQSGWLAGWTVLALLDHAEQLGQVRDNRWLTGAAVYEGLRWGTPIGAVTRRTTQPVVLSGEHIPEGAMLTVCVASANRDATVFPDADEFDIHRTVRTNLGFGAGRHHCPAFAFVTAMARTSLDVYFDRFPNAQPVPGWTAAPHGWKLRLPGSIHMTWDPA
jgi:cytochrome P450